MNDLPAALFAHPGIPTPSWEPRCDLCKLWRDQPEASSWLTEALMNMSLPQEQIAAELASRWAIETTQPQLSRHRTRHLLPDLRSAHETFLAAAVVLEQYGDMPAIELGEKAAKVMIIRLMQRSEEAGEKTVGGIGAAVAKLIEALQKGKAAEIDLQAAGEDLQLTRVKRIAAEGDYQAEFTRFVRDHYPHLLPALLGQAAGDAGQSGSTEVAGAEGSPSASAADSQGTADA